MSDQQAAPPKRKQTKAEKKLEGSAYLATALNARIAEDDARRAAAGLEPLMFFTVPDDFFSRPRLFGFKIDVEAWKAYARRHRIQGGEDPETAAKISSSVLLTNTLFLLRQLTQLPWLSAEWCLPEDYSKAEARKIPPRPCMLPNKDGTPREVEYTPEGAVVADYFVREPPPRFAVLMLYMVTRYKKVLKRPTQKQVDMLSAEINCQPEWYVDAEDDD